MPLAVIPQAGQLSENSAHPSNKQPWDVLHDDVAGSKVANDANEFGPQSRTLAFNTGTSASAADVLAREPSAYKIDGGELADFHSSDIVKPPGVGPVFRQHAPAPRVALDLPKYRPPARAFETKLKPADA